MSYKASRVKAFFEAGIFYHFKHCCDVPFSLWIIDVREPSAVAGVPACNRSAQPSRVDGWLAGTPTTARRQDHQKKEKTVCRTLINKKGCPFSDSPLLRNP